MKLYLMRHAESEDGDRNDPTRQLTDVGRAQTRTMAEFLHRQIGRADVVLSSYFDRAVNTATPIAKALGAPVVKLWQLQPDGDPEEAMTAIQRHGTGDTVVVTHHPLVGKLLEQSAGAKTDDISFHHGHCAHVNGGKLHWFVGPKLVERDEAVTEAVLGVAGAMLDCFRESELEWEL